MPSNNTVKTVTKHVIRWVVERGDEPQDNVMLIIGPVLAFFFVLLTISCCLALSVDFMKKPDSSDDAVDEETKPGYILSHINR